MEPTDLTIKILQEIREEIRGTNSRVEGTNSRIDKLDSSLNARIEKLDAAMSARFEVVESTLKDLAEQMVMLARGIKTALEVRGRLEDHERRLADLEKRDPH